MLTAGVGRIGLRNAAIAACQIVAIGDSEVEGKLAGYLRAETKPPQFDVSLEAV